MPTILPARARPVDASDELLGFLRALLGMYAVIAIAAALLVAIQSTFGVFAAQSFEASVLIATGVELPSSEPSLLLALDPRF